MTKVKSCCSLCNSNENRIIYNTIPFAVVKCLSCSLVRVEPMPDDEERARINQSVYSISDYKKRYFKDKYFFKRWFKNKLERIERLCSKKGKLLDIGCSYGFFLEVANERGWDVYGVERNPVSGGAVKERFGDKVFIGLLENAHLEKRSFDVITLWDVIEHIPQPVEFLCRLKDYLRPDGILCLQVPNINSFISELKGVSWDWLTPGDHLYFFSPETIMQMIAQSGFESIHFRTWEPTGYFIDSVIGFNEYNNIFFEIYRKTIVRLARKLLFFVFLPFQKQIASNNKGALIEIFMKLP